MDRNLEFETDIKKLVQLQEPSFTNMNDVVIVVDKNSMIIHIDDNGFYRYAKFTNYKLGPLIILLQKYGFDLDNAIYLRIECHPKKYPTVSINKWVSTKLSKMKEE